MGDLSGDHGLLRASPDDIRKAARFQLMQSSDMALFRQVMAQRFDMHSLREARSELAEVIGERGLLGPFYVAASDFPSCHKGRSATTSFVHRYARQARYVLAKNQCSDCVHKVAGGGVCSVFEKQIQFELPYTEAEAAALENQQRGRGYVVTASTGSPRERIRLALLAPQHEVPAPAALPKPVENVARLLQAHTAPEALVLPPDLTGLRQAARAAIGEAMAEGRYDVHQAQAAYKRVASTATPEGLADETALAQGVPLAPRPQYVGAGQQTLPAPEAASVIQANLVAASNLTRQRDEKVRMALAADKAKPVLALLRKEMLLGRSETELAHALKSAFTTTDLAATREHWAPLFREAGLYGALYATQESFPDCREGASFVATHNPGLRAMVAGEKCTGCIYNKVGRCLVYGKPLLASVNDLLTPETVQQVFVGHKMAGKVAAWDTHLIQGTPREALKALHKAAAMGATAPKASRDTVVRAFTGHAPQHTTRTDTLRAIVASAQRHLNEGLYGADLGRALRARFDARDLVAAKDDLKKVMAEQGLQGIYFVDPTIYPDYGHGCREAARLHRARQVPYVKAGSKCLGCVHQAQAGQCSMLGKPLVAEVPYPGDKAELQRQMLASGPATKINPADLVNNGRNMMAEFELQQRGMEVNLDPETTLPEITTDLWGRL